MVTMQQQADLYPTLLQALVQLLGRTIPILDRPEQLVAEMRRLIATGLPGDRQINLSAPRSHRPEEWFALVTARLGWLADAVLDDDEQATQRILHGIDEICAAWLMDIRR